MFEKRRCGGTGCTAVLHQQDAIDPNRELIERNGHRGERLVLEEFINRERRIAYKFARLRTFFRRAGRGGRRWRRTPTARAQVIDSIHARR